MGIAGPVRAVAVLRSDLASTEISVFFVPVHVLLACAMTPILICPAGLKPGDIVAVLNLDSGSETEGMPSCTPLPCPGLRQATTSAEPFLLAVAG